VNKQHIDMHMHVLILM